MKEKITVCGVYCSSECHAFNEECAGCNQLAGKVSWAPEIGQECCPLYTCVVGKGFQTCAECAEVPCEIWLVETKNPAVSEAAFAAEVKRRVSNLKRLNGK